MSEWSDRFNNNQIHKQIEGAMVALGSVKTDTLSDIDTQRCARVSKAITYVKLTLTSIDPELIGTQLLNGLAVPLANITTNVNQFIQNKNAGHLQNATNYADQMLDALGAIRFTDNPNTVKATIEASTVFQAKTIEELSRMNARANAFVSATEALASNINQQKERLDSNDKTIEQQKTRLDQAITQFQKQFSDAEANRAKQFSDVEANRAKDFSISTQKQNDAFNSETAKFKQTFDATIAANKVQAAAHQLSVTEETKKHLDWMEQKEFDVKRIFNVIGNVAVAGDYKNAAEREGKSANTLRWIALGLMGSMVIVAVITFTYSLFNHEFDWRIFGFRLATSIILAIPAVYAAQESSKHREREKANRKLHLELSAIDAYLELLPPEQRQQIKGKMTEKFFGLTEAVPKEDEVTKHALLDILKNVVGNLTKGK